MTKVTILGEEPQETKKKPIEFIRLLEDGGDFNKNPEGWQNILLLEKNYKNNMDLMYVYDNGMGSDGSRKHSVLVLGHFNDGVVE